jgi:hypothetical protein
LEISMNKGDLRIASKSSVTAVNSSLMAFIRQHDNLTPGQRYSPPLAELPVYPAASVVAFLEDLRTQ